MNLAAIRSGITSLITTAMDDITMTGYLLTPIISPGFEIEIADMPYDATFGRGTDEYDLTLRAWLSLNETDESQKRMDNWLDGTAGESVKAILEADKTLGGACDDCRVTRAISRRAMPAESNALYLVGEWTVHVMGAPS